jgi:hypothetical protein
MTDKARIRIAAAVTALFLAGISAAGLAARDDRPQAATTTVPPTAASQTPTASASSGDRGDSERYEADHERSEEFEDDE